MTQTQHSLIALELNRTLAMSASWDEAAEALRRARRSGDFSDYDRAMDAFWNTEPKGREGQPNKRLPTDK